MASSIHSGFVVAAKPKPFRRLRTNYRRAADISAFSHLPLSGQPIG